MVTREHARLLAEALLDARVRPELDEEILILEEFVEEDDHSWIFFYNTRAYLETRLHVHSLVENDPILVDRKNAAVRFGRFAVPSAHR